MNGRDYFNDISWQQTTHVKLTLLALIIIRPTVVIPSSRICFILFTNCLTLSVNVNNALLHFPDAPNNWEIKLFRYDYKGLYTPATGWGGNAIQTTNLAADKSCLITRAKQCCIY